MRGFFSGDFFVSFVHDLVYVWGGRYHDDREEGVGFLYEKSAHSMIHLSDQQKQNKYKEEKRKMSQ